MTRILLIGQTPDTVDYSDPALPPGLTAATIAAGIKAGLAAIEARGWIADHCLVDPDESAGPKILDHLAGADYDCIVIGGGIRIPPRSLRLFETVINAVHKGAPNAVIAFNTKPDESAEVAARQLARR